MIQERMRQRGGDTGRAARHRLVAVDLPFGGGNFGGRGGATNSGRRGR